MDVVTLGAAKAAGDKRYALNNAPSTAGVRTKRFDPSRSAYNFHASNTQKLRAAVASARAGAALTDHLCIGDSKTQGYTSGGTGALTAWPRTLSDCLATMGVPTTGGAATPDGPLGFGQTDARWSFGSGWTTDATGAYAKNSTQGSAITFVSDRVGTVVEIYYLDSSPNFQYQIDGGSVVPITTASTGNTIKIQVTGLTNTTHTVTAQSTAAGSFAIAEILVRETYGMQFHNMGVGGFFTSSWNTGLTKPDKLYQCSVLAPTAQTAWIALGINDAGSSVSAATMSTNLTGIINTLQAFSSVPDIFLIVESYGNTPSTWTPYIPSLYALADSFDIPLIDLFDYYGAQPTPINNGIINGTDDLHETVTGHMATGQLLASIITGSAA